MSRLSHGRSCSRAFILALALSGCASKPIAVVPLPMTETRVGVIPARQLYSIKNGIKVSNTGAVLPKSWNRATGFCSALGKEPREEQPTQQWPAVRDFVFSCVPVPDRHFQ